MALKLVSKNKEKLVVEVEIPLDKTMLEGEDLIQNALKKVNNLTAAEILKQLDSDDALMTRDK